MLNWLKAIWAEANAQPFVTHRPESIDSGRFEDEVELPYKPPYAP